MAVKDHLTKQEEVERAIEHYRRVRFLEETNASFAALGVEGLADYRLEASIWDLTLTDGLEGET